ncbi:RNA-guided endonuclease TnpB family protein [Paenibacillus sp. J2TS4]|uniref:RNA-guided endonuclease InsQ/TnpB family protein n=1 Tax=Paenibacillus sp. J2TS4 TaxID=2807194 RepID=UPI001B148397|nr:RNA-guided endonuclease TnpB family protein [Paenibacillus sp. J2TS4]GIP33927.1 transposase [Paenibacillus sp. J2TS4]
MKITLTAKVKILPTPEQIDGLRQTLRAYRLASDYLSKLVFEEKILSKTKLHQLMYRELRSAFSLRSQMAQSVMRTVIARYKSLVGNGHLWTFVRFKKPELDLVWRRDYSLTKRMFSINTLHGRIKVAYETKGMESYFDGSWSFGTAKLVHKRGKFFLHLPMTKEVEEVSDQSLNQVVGLDMGINFVVTSYDSQGQCTFFHGRPIKNKRSKYKHLRKQLQQLGTASARRKLKRIGGRENRWMTDINHRISKALVRRYGAHTLFVLEDLTGVRNRTERVRVQDRYETVSWSFYQLRQMITYKAILHGAKVIAVDPRYTSQACPKCEHTERANRDKKRHRFCCQKCGYRSNDDRIGAMNLQRIGIQYIAEVAV